jgi:hypothetical protein
MGRAGWVYQLLCTYEPEAANKARALELLEDAIGHDTGDARIDPGNAWRVKAAELLKDTDPEKSRRYVKDAVTYTRNHNQQAIPALKKKLKDAGLPDESTTD